jgi:UPF0042 nucleotide-binding protein
MAATPQEKGSEHESVVLVRVARDEGLVGPTRALFRFGCRFGGRRLGLGDDRTVSLLFESFAYRRGVPADADFVFDARSLPNPHWDARLRPLSGRDREIREYLDAQDDAREYVRQVSGFLDHWLPKMQGDTRSYITIAFGCTGGRHRSVYLAETLAAHARATGWREVATFHRELE